MTGPALSRGPPPRPEGSSPAAAEATISPRAVGGTLHYRELTVQNADHGPALKTATFAGRPDAPAPCRVGGVHRGDPGGVLGQLGSGVRGCTAVLRRARRDRCRRHPG